MQVANPILPGCYPDPSICRVGDDYFLVCSTFEYLPGLPVFHSRDLANWQQIGHAISREGMMTYDGLKSSNGLFAPTIRFNPNDKKFYIVCTLVGTEADQQGQSDAAGPAGGNFIITAENPAGPWSDPIWIAKPGIDPSLFFDSDGKIWLHGTRIAEPGEWFHQTEVWLQQIDPETLQPIGEETILWTGAVRGAVWCEGPHIYKIGEYYYLLTAEAGTEFHHAISIARAKEITGPYEGNKGNPIFTHRHLGRMFPIMGVGHADLVPFASASFANPEAGPWFAVLLGMRLYGGYHYNLGRETFLVPVIWEDGWPVFAPGEGKIPATVALPDLMTMPGQMPGTPRRLGAVSSFLGIDKAISGPQMIRAGLVESWDPRWTAVRALPTTVAQPAGPAWLLPVRTTTLAEKTVPSFLGIRQSHKNCDIAVTVDFASAMYQSHVAGAWAGIAIRQSESDFATFLATPVAGEPGAYVVKVEVQEKGEIRVINITKANSINTKLNFLLEVREQNYACYLQTETSRIPMGVIDGRTLDTAAAGGFLGLWLGVYATRAQIDDEVPTDDPVVATTLTYTPR